MGADGITAFIVARADELETGARKNQELYARLFPGASWGQVICDPVTGPFGGQTRSRNIGTGMYVAGMSEPAAVLRQVQAIHRMLARHHAREDGMCAAHPYVRIGACPELRDLAAIWAGHPAYEAGWSP